MGSDGGKSNTLTGTQRGMLDAISRAVQGQIGRGVEAYGGEIAPDASALQQLAFDRIGGWGSDSSMSNALTRLLSGAPSVQTGPEQYDAYFGRAIEDPARRAFRDTTMRQISNKYGVSGAGMQASLDAGVDLEVGLAGERSKFGLEGLRAQQALAESGANRQVQGAGLWLQNQMSAIDTALRGGDTQYQVAAAQNAEGYEKWKMSQPYNNPYVNRWGPIAVGTQAFTAIPGHGKF